MFRRHPILSTLVVLLLLALATVATFIATFDLNRYREQLQSTLSATLSQPVHLGEARFTLRHGPAFNFADLRIGAGDGEVGVLQADHLLLKLELLPLLKRQVTFSEIQLDAPHYNLTLRAPTAAAGSPSPALLLDQGLLGTTLIRSLKVSNGTLHLLDLRDPERSYAITLDRLEAHIANISLNRPTRLHLAGNLIQNGSTSAFVLNGEIEANGNRPDWKGLGINLELTLNHFLPEPLLQRYFAAPQPLTTDGTLSLTLGLNGSVATGLRVEGQVDGKDLKLQLPDRYLEPFAYRQIYFAGNWAERGLSQQFTDLSLQADDLALTGGFTLTRKEEQTWLDGELASGRLPLDEVGRFLPGTGPDGEADRLRRILGGGTVEIESAKFSGPLSGFSRLDTDFPLQHGSLRVRDAILRLERGGPLRGLNFSVQTTKELVAVRDGRGLFLGAPFQFSATLAEPFGPARKMQLNAETTLPLQPLLALIPGQRPDKFTAGGPISLQLEIVGPLDRLLLDFKANLEGAELGWDERPIKLADQPGSLFLTGELTPGRLELSHGRLQMPPLEIRAQAHVDRSAEKRFQCAFDLAPLPLEQTLPFLPAMQRFALQGELSGHFEMSGANAQLSRRVGTLYLRDFGMHLAGAVADIHNANAQLQLRDDGVDLEKCSANLGISPVRIEGSVRNFSDPRIELHVQAKTIRADELIFPSEKAVLRDVDGHLVIDKSGILFAPVKVRLDGGTAATVEGDLKNFSAPQVSLEITAERANIDEVIGLWQHPKATKDKTTEGKGKGSLLIKARVREGILGPLHFQNAEGEIGLVDGALTIFPLHFDAGAGTCTGRVEVDKTADGSSLLRMSGHLENFDAEALQHELLKRRGLVTGTLNGDFYLEGEPGSRFLPSSLGGFNLQIKDGVLRKFTVLSKVFSILNISQLFALRLPDMANEGMPFRRLKGNFSLSRGVLGTEDLFIDSNAMNLSMVGQSNLITGEIDAVLGVKPLRTVDKIVTQIPIAGWLLTGEEKALITAHFELKGKGDDPEVTPIPITSVSEKALGIFKRVLGLPGKVVTDMGELLQGEKK